MINLSEVIISQYQASLAMIKQAVAQCPDPLWNNPDDKNKFWNVAYHALFFTHLYLHECQDAFVPWEKHRQEYQFLGQTPWPPHHPPRIGEPYNKSDVLDYVDFCCQQVIEKVPHVNWEAESGFHWLPFNKLELQIYSIRHLQQHTGELMERLGSQANVEWVASKS